MPRGRNRADLATFTQFTKTVESASRATPCIFISHMSVDSDACASIVDYLLGAGVDVYFDKRDRALDQLVKEGNSDKITKRIQEGVDRSTHMLAVVSPATVTSYWVPFEIGYGYGKIGLGVLTLKGLLDKDLPDYLKTTRVVRGTLSLNQFISELLGTERQLLESRMVIKVTIQGVTRVS